MAVKRHTRIRVELHDVIFCLVAPLLAGVPMETVSAADVSSAVTPDETLSEVIVTATRREEIARDVPASLSVLGGSTLDELGAKSLQDYAGLVPGLQTASDRPGYSVQTLRGISTGILATGATVGTYLNDTPLGSSSVYALGAQLTPDPDLFDVERIEVLKGPQGTLYGASSLGGLIKYVLAQPNLTKFEGRAEVGYEGVEGHGQGHSERLVVNLPLLENVLAIRASGFQVKSPGYIDNVFTGARDINSNVSEGGRLAALWVPTDALRIQASTNYQKLNDDNSSGIDVDPLTLQPTSGDLKTAIKVPAPLRTQSYVHNLTIGYGLPWADILSSTSFARTNSFVRYDASNFYGALYGGLIGGNAADARYNAETKKATEELRVTSKGDSPLSWVGGFFFTHEISALPENLDQFTAAPSSLTPVFPNFLTVQLNSSLRETAGFGDLGYKFSPAFDVQVGVRYSRITQNYDQLDFTLFGQPALPDLRSDATQSKPTYLGIARYHFDSDSMAYLRVATGYRPGGANTVITGVSHAPATFDPDNLISYEFGVKGTVATLFDYTVDAFRVNWKQIQVTGIDPASGFAFFGNGGKAHSQGLEFEVSFRPLTGLRLGLSGALIDAVLDDSIAINGVDAKSGDELPYAPKYSLAALIDYEHSLTSDVRGFAGLTVKDQGARRAYFSGQTAGIPSLGPGFSTPQGTLPAYASLDLRAGLGVRRVTFTGYAQNVTDKRGAVALNSTFAGVDLAKGTVGPALLEVIQPRTFGVTARVDF